MGCLAPAEGLVLSASNPNPGDSMYPCTPQVVCSSFETLSSDAGSCENIRRVLRACSVLKKLSDSFSWIGSDIDLAPSVFLNSGGCGAPPIARHFCSRVQTSPP